MTEIGFAAALDVDLTLESDDELTCMIDSHHPGEARQAVMDGVINAPCGHRQLVCLECYDRNKPRFRPGDACWCYPCPYTPDGYGIFEGWVKV